VKPDRAAITALLDEFIPDVVAQKDLKRGWQLVDGVAKTTPYKEWLKGNTSVQAYPAKGTHFPGWIVGYSYPGDVGFDILLQPTKKSVGPWSFRAEHRRSAAAGSHDPVPVATYARQATRPCWAERPRPGNGAASRERPERPPPPWCWPCRWGCSPRSRSAPSVTASRAGRASAAGCANRRSLAGDR
jgi:hypothetical protein